MREKFFEKTMTQNMRRKRIAVLWEISLMCVIAAFLTLIPVVDMESTAVIVGMPLLFFWLGGMHVKIAQNANDIDKLLQAMGDAPEATKATLAD